MESYSSLLAGLLCENVITPSSLGLKSDSKVDVMGRAIPGIVTVEGVVKGLKANRSSVAEKKKNPPKAVVANKEDTSSISTTPLPNAKKMMQTPVVPLLNAKKVMQNPVVAKEPNNVKLLEGRVMTRASWKRAIAHVHEEEERPVKLLKRNTTQ